MAKKKTTAEPDIESGEVAVEHILETEVVDQPQGIVKLSHFEQKIVELRKHKELTIAGVNDRKGYTAVETARKEVKRERLSAVKVAEELEYPLKDLLGQIRDKKKSLESDFKEIESDLDQKASDYERMVKEEQEARAAAAKEKFESRMAQLHGVGAVWNGFTSYKVGDYSLTSKEVETISDEDFADRLSKMEEAGVEIRKREEEERKAEEERLAKIKAEEERLAEVARQQAEAQAEIERQKKELEEAKAKIEQDAIRAENERKAAERKALFDKRLAEVKAISNDIHQDDEGNFLSYRDAFLLNITDIPGYPQEEWDATIADLPASLKAVDDEIAESERILEEAKVKAEKDAADAAVAAEKKRKADEEKEAARQEQLKPDKEKFSKLAERLRDIKLEPTTAEGEKLLKKVKAKAEELSNFINEQIKNL